MWNLNLFLSAAHCLNLGVPQFVILGDFDSTDPSELEEKRIKVKGESLNRYNLFRNHGLNLNWFRFDLFSFNFFHLRLRITPRLPVRNARERCGLGEIVSRGQVQFLYPAGLSSLWTNTFPHKAHIQMLRHGLGVRIAQCYCSWKNIKG